MVEAAPAPETLDRQGLECWAWAEPRLRAVGLLTELDYHALTLLCEAWQDYRDCRQIVDFAGPTYSTKGPTGIEMVRKRPELEQANVALGQFRALANDLGLTPADRSRLSVDQSQAEDDFEDFLTSS